MDLLPKPEPTAEGGDLPLLVVGANVQDGPDQSYTSDCPAAVTAPPPAVAPNVQFTPCHCTSHERVDSSSETLWSPTSIISEGSGSRFLPYEDTIIDDHDDLETKSLIDNSKDSNTKDGRYTWIPLDNLNKNHTTGRESPGDREDSEIREYTEEEEEEEQYDERRGLLSLEDEEGGEMHMRSHISWVSYFAFTRQSHVYILVLAILSAIASAAILPLSSILLGKIFGEFALYGRGEATGAELLANITEWIKYYVVLAGGGWVIYGVFYCSWIWFGELQAESARKRLYAALLAKELEWFDNTDHEITKVASRCHTQIREFQSAASQPLGLLVQCIFTAFGALGIAFYHSWHLTLICLAGMPIATVLVWFFSNRIEKGIDEQSLAFGSAAQSISRAVNGIDTVKYFNGQKAESSLYATAIKSAGLAYNRIAKHAAYQNGFMRFITLMVFVQGFWYASTLVSETTPFVELAGYMTTFWACLIAGQQIESILPLVILLEKGKVAASNLRRLCAKDVEYDMLKRAGVYPKRCNGFIAFNDVKFTYPSRRDVPSLNGLSLFINAGDVVFIVGKSGSGKSTLANLLLTVWKHNSGSIFIDEHPLERLDREWVYENVTYVPQRPALFNETISHNIRFGTKDTDGLTMKDLRRACDDVFLTETLLSYPYQHKTVIRSGGANLSGGQRQRVSLARARLRNTPIMILDEPTSGLDERTKVLVMENLREWRKAKTTVVITHNLADIRPDDYVYVMDKGAVVQTGYRKNLETAYKGAFADLLRESGVPGPAPIPAPTPMSLYQESFMDYYIGDKENTTPNPNAGKSDFEPTENVLQSSLKGPNTRKSMNRVAFASDHRGAALPLPVTQTIDRSASYRRSKRKPRRTRQSMEEIPPLPESKSKPGIDRSFSHIFGTVRAHTTVKQKLVLVIGLIATVITASATPAFSYALARLVETFFSDFTGAKAMFWSLLIIGIAIVDAFAASLQLYCLEYVGQRWIDSVRARAYQLVLKQARSWFDVDKNQVGRIAQDLEQNAEEMRNLLGRFVGFALNGATILIVGVAWSLTQDLELTAVGLAAAPALLIVLRVFTWVSDRYEEKGNSEAERLGLFLQDVLANLVTVRVLSLREYFEHKHRGMLHQAMAVGRKRAFFTGLTVGLSDTAVSLATALIFWYGARLIATKSLPLSDALTVFTLLLFSLSNSAAALRIIPQVSSSKDAACRVLRLLELKEICHENQGSRKVDLDGSLIIRNVCFSYPSQRHTTVLRNVSLQVNPGEVIAIVGTSGAGKSTLVSLLERLYAPSSGDIIYSGYHSSDLDIEHLRRRIAIVPQHPYLFPASVKDNILYGIDRHNDADVPQLAQIMQACRDAGLIEWVEGLKDGYDTLLSMGDSSVSGGQLQKIALARALVRNPRVLVLDECTNSLDQVGAGQVMETLYGLRRAFQAGPGGMRKYNGPTIIMVTHMSEMMKMADRIIVMEGGQVVDDGGFRQLVATSEPFRRILRQQEEGDVML
ncbi:hypothetical protein ABW19_dt0201890 [Dactylella cylindrospora]|nr:hypothetical protein ABW19_dt0201890 [Dactylella cylindrospora]